MVTPTRNIYIQNTLYIQLPKKDQLIRQQEKDKHFGGLLFSLEVQLTVIYKQKEQQERFSQH